MYSIYDSAVKAHCEQMQYAAEYIPFSIWLERQKLKGMYWGV